MEGGQFGYARLLATGGFTKGVNGVRTDLNVTRSDGWRDEGGFKRQSATIRWDGGFGGFTTKTVLAGSNTSMMRSPREKPAPCLLLRFFISAS